MSDFVVLWKNEERREWDCDFFETREEADQYVAEWSAKCPFNTYRILNTVFTAPATEPYPRATYSVSEQGKPYKVTIGGNGQQ